MRFSRIRNGFRDEHGIILPLVLVLLALGVLLIAPTLGHGATGLTAHSITEDKAAELYAADSGIEEALYWLVNGHLDNDHWTWDKDAGTGSREEYVLNGASVDVSVADTGEVEDNKTIYHVRSTASGLRDNSSTTVDARAKGYSFGSFEEDSGIDIGPSGNISGGTVPEGESYVCESDVENVGGGFQIDGTVVFKGTVDQFAGNTMIGGLAVFCEHVNTFTGSSDSTGTAVFCGGLGKFSGSSSMGFNLVVVGDLYIDGNADLQGDTIVFGNIDAKNSAHNLGGNVCCTGTIADVVNYETATVTTDCGDSSDYCYLCSDDLSQFDILSYEIE